MENDDAEVAQAHGPTPILLDVDTGTDDALALLYAVAHPGLRLLGVSCVAGNASLERVLDNTARVLDAASAPDVPIAAGAAKPLIERMRPEGQFHGEDGLGGIELPAPQRSVSAQPAVEMLYEQIVTSAQPVTVVALAPMTNIAALLTLHPDVADHLGRIVFMGGSTGTGNVTAVAEFNVWQDPEAASCVVESGLAVTMYGLDVFDRLLIDQATADRWLAADHRALRLAGALLHHRGLRSEPEPDYQGVLGDAGALVVVTNPELFSSDHLPVRVNLEGLGRGQTIVDRRPLIQDEAALSRDPWRRIDVTLDLDVDAAADVYTRLMQTYPLTRASAAP